MVSASLLSAPQLSPYAMFLSEIVHLYLDLGRFSVIQRDLYVHAVHFALLVLLGCLLSPSETCFEVHSVNLQNSASLGQVVCFTNVCNYYSGCTIFNTSSFLSGTP